MTLQDNSAEHTGLLGFCMTLQDNSDERTGLLGSQGLASAYQISFFLLMSKSGGRACQTSLEVGDVTLGPHQGKVCP